MRFASFIPRAALLGLLLLLAAGNSWSGITPFTDRGKIDFDTAMGMLNPYGTWAQTDGLWAYTPLDHAAPYTHGRWLYTEFGWTWQGTMPNSWLTEHYGYWKRGANHVWAWYPGFYWLPQTVEIRVAPTGIGWRSAEVDADGNFVETASERFTKIDEWIFVSPAQFAGPITPAVMAKPEVAERLLEESVEALHNYQTYRQLVRPGPHPADFVTLGDGRMFAPMTGQERQRALVPVTKPAPKSDVPKPTLVGVDPEDPEGDARQVNYWVTMSLPTLWTPPPADAQRNQIFLYRPDFFQDQDGIERRIGMWIDPSIRAKEKANFREAFNRPRSAAGQSPAVAADAVPAVPASPAVPARSSDPFASPFEDSFRPGEGQKAPSASTKTSVRSAGAPLSAAGAPISAAGAPTSPTSSPLSAAGAPVNAAGAPSGTNPAPVPAAGAP